jgi:hypothetical protein
MATGAAPAFEPKAETKTETPTETSTAQPVTLKERVVGVLTKIFHGRDEYLGWRQ